MKNYQKIAVALMVGVSAIGFSAFKSTSANTKFATIYYVLSNASTYTKYTGSGQPAEAGCQDIANHKCVIGFTSDRGPTLNPNSLPATPSYQSDGLGLWVQP